ncbi:MULTISPECIES: hypothetical protein [unclassified Sulfuricurvum]|uniref:hypothetical protein n=1 Tax=unclassified Sulfuricurvum TaxID=2632390 RepID=UPI00029997AC|nr:MULTISPECIES: hypothetical protein [unclassified Sulfuricurvum]AFV96532.1 hypothetical protein B649_01090 [Candidatus Sulfuricurvum sp. RIFRC-1]HBM35990.1 hypothetical protein [Sulfuricurvum sp.]
MNVSPDFSLPLRWIAPYFIVAVIFYIVSMSFLFFLPSDITLRDFRVIGWVHLYMIGFVMMVIIGAIGQLSVVVGEVHHRYPRVFGWIWPLLMIGTALLAMGFIRNPSLLGVGGGFILGALSLFVFNLFMTLHRSRRRTSVTLSMQWSTLFLSVGLGIGLMMALGYGGMIPIDPTQWRMGHIFAVFGGYVMLNIMGVSTVLLPMFGACNRPSDREHTISFTTMIVSVIGMILASALQLEWLEKVALLFGMGSVGFYMVQVYRIFTSKKRGYTDIWERSLAVAFIALVISMGLGVYGIIVGSEKAVLLSFWFLTAGFLGFLITAHLYKIVPFLVWFERYAPYIDEREVPMLHQLLPTQWASVQWGLAVSGLVAIAIAIGLANAVLWKIGTALLAGSGIVLLAILIKLLRDKL